MEISRNGKGQSLYRKAKKLFLVARNFLANVQKCFSLSYGHRIILRQKDAKFGILMVTSILMLAIWELEQMSLVMLTMKLMMLREKQLLTVECAR